MSYQQRSYILQLTHHVPSGLRSWHWKKGMTTVQVVDPSTLLKKKKHECVCIYIYIKEFIVCTSIYNICDIMYYLLIYIYKYVVPRPFIFTQYLSWFGARWSNTRGTPMGSWNMSGGNIHIAIQAILRLEILCFLTKACTNLLKYTKIRSHT